MINDSSRNRVIYGISVCVCHSRRNTFPQNSIKIDLFAFFLFLLFLLIHRNCEHRFDRRFLMWFEFTRNEDGLNDVSYRVSIWSLIVSLIRVSLQYGYFSHASEAIIVTSHSQDASFIEGFLFVLFPQEDLLIHGDSVYDIIDKQDHGSIQAELSRSIPQQTTGSGSHHSPISSLEGEQRMFLCRMNVSRNARRQMRFGDQKVCLDIVDRTTYEAVAIIWQIFLAIIAFVFEWVTMTITSIALWNSLSIFISLFPFFSPNGFVCARATVPRRAIETWTYFWSESVSFSKASECVGDKKYLSQLPRTLWYVNKHQQWDECDATRRGENRSKSKQNANETIFFLLLLIINWVECAASWHVTS